MRHPLESELALLAGGDCGRVRRFFLRRHVRGCEACSGIVADYEMLRLEIGAAELPSGLTGRAWDNLAREMGANIRLGLAAGECVAPKPARAWEPRMVFALAGVLLLLGTAILYNRNAARVGAPAMAAGESRTVIESSAAGIEVRTGGTSITLSNRHGAMADQTVGAQGEIRARYIDGETGAVTINNVYLE